MEWKETRGKDKDIYTPEEEMDKFMMDKYAMKAGKGDILHTIKAMVSPPPPPPLSKRATGCSHHSFW